MGPTEKLIATMARKGDPAVSGMGSEQVPSLVNDLRN